ncbi:MAG TPA: alpha/beta hydrolase-fold protein [Melioribacteraceae bacterium]|nr:alpha/beta hydrolase-fold protein [Melioribacteraceae bacterium]
MYALILCFLLIYSVLNAPSKFDNFVLRLERTLNSNKSKLLIDEYINKHNNKLPIIEGNEVNFVYVGNVNSVELIGDMQYWSEESIKLNKISGTKLFYKKLIFKDNAKIDYLYKINNSKTILDPFNTNIQSGAFGTNSVLKMPNSFSIIDYLNADNTLQYSFNDSLLIDSTTNLKYSVSILLPPNYNEENDFDVVYFNAGKDYLNFAEAKTTIEKLTSYGFIKPFIAVFIEPNNFIDDYTAANRFNYCSFISNTIVPFIDNNYKTLPNANNRILIGDSYGGNITCLTAVKFYNVFTNFALQSPDFSPNNYEVFNLFSNFKNKQLSFCIVGGTYETIINSINSFVNILDKNNIKYMYLKFPQGHSWGLWKQTLADILIFYLPSTVINI